MLIFSNVPYRLQGGGGGTESTELLVFSTERCTTTIIASLRIWGIKGMGGFGPTNHVFENVVPTLKNGPRIECHFSRLAQAVHEVLTQYGPHGLHGPLEQLDWSDIQADLT